MQLKINLRSRHIDFKLDFFLSGSKMSAQPFLSSDKNTSPYGQINSQNAQNNQPWGQQVSAGAQDPNTSHNGISDFRANGCKLVGGNNGQGGNIC